MPLKRWMTLPEIDGWLGRQLARAGTSAEMPALAPVIDIRRDDQQYLLRAELPGAEAENIRIQVDKGVLTLSGDARRAALPASLGGRRAWGAAFSRSFALPADVHADALSAECRSGVVTIRLPRAAPVRGAGRP